MRIKNAHFVDNIGMIDKFQEHGTCLFYYVNNSQYTFNISYQILMITGGKAGYHTKR